MPETSRVRKIHLLPNLLTLANAFCGLLAICKGIDALASGGDATFYAKMEAACWLIFLGMAFDAVDGKVARMVGGSSNFGAQLDSFSDMLTFGVAPAVLAKTLIEHEGPLYDYPIHARLNFIAAVVFSLMAILRLARFNLENDPDPAAHKSFKGLPSPGAAGMIASTMLMYLSLKNPNTEFDDGSPTPFGALLRLVPQIHQSPFLSWFLPALALLLPACGLLMVSRVRYTHMFSWLTGRGQFVTLVTVVVAAALLFTAPPLSMFLVFAGYVLFGLVRAALPRRQSADVAQPGPPAPLSR